MFGITDLTTYLIGTILIILLPGPNSLYVMSVASRNGQKAGYRAAWGVLTGDTILMLLTVIGAASLLKAVPMLFIILKVIGAIYLGWLGSQLLGAALQRWRSRHLAEQIAFEPSTSSNRYFARAMSISLLNPKAILFFLSFFIQFVDPTYPYPSLSFLILGILLQICSLTYLSSLIFAGAKMADFFKSHRILSTLGIASVGILFFGFALKLVVSSI